MLLGTLGPLSQQVSGELGRRQAQRPQEPLGDIGQTKDAAAKLGIMGLLYVLAREGAAQSE